MLMQGGMRRTALHWACQGGHVHMVELLMEYGADTKVEFDSPHATSIRTEPYTERVKERRQVSRGQKGVSECHWVSAGMVLP